MIAPGRQSGGSAGFSLLEMLVAVAILGMALGALYQAAGTATHGDNLGATDGNGGFGCQPGQGKRHTQPVVTLCGHTASAFYCFFSFNNKSVRFFVGFNA